MLTYRWTLAETERFINRLISHGWLITFNHDNGSFITYRCLSVIGRKLTVNWHYGECEVIAS